MSRQGWMGLLVLALLASSASVARANAGDVVGFGSESIARGGAMTAATDGAEALHYNPAGLIAAERAELSVGYMRFLSTLSWTGVTAGVSESHDADISQPDSVTIGLVVPLGRIAVGAYISTLTNKLLALRIDTTTAPTFGYYANRTQRIVVLLGAAIDLGHGLSIGGGLNIFGGVDGLVLASEGPTRDVEPGIFIGDDTALSGQLGLRLEVNDDLRLGLAYRHRFRVPVKIQSDSTVGNVPLNITFVVDGLQTPYELAAVGALNVGAVELSLDATWSRWRNLRAPWVDVDALGTGLRLGMPPVPPASPAVSHRTLLRLGCGRPLGVSRVQSRRPSGLRNSPPNWSFAAVICSTWKSMGRPVSRWPHVEIARLMSRCFTGSPSPT